MRALLALMVLFALGCAQTPSEPAWDRCYRTIDFQGEDVVRCEKDTVYRVGE